jgi:hypothetical protein
MSDTSNADYSAEEGFPSGDDGLAEANNLESFEMDASEGSVQESESPLEALFEIDGTTITLEEAKKGYLRQSDYTKKTQELAAIRSQLAEAEAIAEALRNNPAETIAALSEAFGLTQQQVVDMRLEDADYDYDPQAERIAALERKLEAQERAESQKAVEKELHQLHEQFGEFDDNMLFAHAIKHNFPNLRSAYADMNFEALKSQYDEVSSKLQEESKRVEAKREASGVVHNGASRTKATAEVAPHTYGSIRDAYLAAKKSLTKR